MQVSRNLSLVIPVYRDDEVIARVYARPINRVAFEAHHKIMARAWSDLNESGIGSTGLMTTASFALKDAAVALYGEKDGLPRYHSLIIEVLSGATIILSSPTGYKPIPYDNAVGSGSIDDEDAHTIQSLLCFFTLASRMVDPQWGAVLRLALKLNYAAQFSSLSLTEFQNSLPTSTKADSTGESPIV